MSMKKFPDFMEQRFLLEEYKEQGLCWRHDDDVFSKLTAVLLPLSIGALTLPYLRAETPKLLAAYGGLMLMMFWYLSSESYEHRFQIRWTRIHEIERILGLDSHLRIHWERSKSLLKGQRLRRCMFWLYLPIAFFVTCDLKVEATDPKVKVAHSVVQFIHVFSDPKVETALWIIDLWSTDAWVIKFVITAKTIVSFIIIVVVVIAVCIGYRHNKKYRAEKRFKRRPKGA